MGHPAQVARASHRALHLRKLAELLSLLSYRNGMHEALPLLSRSAPLDARHIGQY